MMRPIATAALLMTVHFAPVANSFPLPCQNHHPHRRRSIRSLSSEHVDDFGFGTLRGSKHSKGLAPPSKDQLYSNDELQNLLDLHNQVKDTTSKKDEDRFPISPSLHDAVLAAIRDSDTTTTDSAIRKSLSFDVSQPLYPVTSKMQTVLPKIRIIASDVDGTILTSAHALHPRTARAIERALEATNDPASPLQHFILATGKTRAGALNSLGPKLQARLSQTPGVYIQGLYCVDGTGRVVYEKRLELDVVQAAMELAEDFETSLFCYDGDLIQATTASSDDHITEFNVRWGEPEPRRADDKTIAQYASGYHKVLFMDSDTNKIQSMRPALEVLAAKHNCVVTQAVSTMLELLPPDSNKAVGVSKLCQALGMSGTELLSIGDGENDVEFLQGAAFSVAVGNAVPGAKLAADVVLTETNDDGAAGVAIELFGLAQILDYE